MAARRRTAKKARPAKGGKPAKAKKAKKAKEPKEVKPGPPVEVVAAIVTGLMLVAAILLVDYKKGVSYGTGMFFAGQYAAFWEALSDEIERTGVNVTDATRPVNEILQFVKPGAPQGLGADRLTRPCSLRVVSPRWSSGRQS